MRVHELAKELGLTSKSALAKLKELGIELKGPSSGLSGEQEAKAREALGKSPAPKAAVASIAPQPRAAAASPAQPSKLPSMAAKRSAALQRERATQAAVAQARRRVRPGSAAAIAAARSSRGRGVEEKPAGEAQESPTTATAAAPAAEPATEARPGPARPAPAEQRDTRRPGPGAARKGGPPQQLVVPKIEVMKLDEARKASGGRKRKRGAKKAETPAGQAGQRGRRSEGRSRIAPSFVLAPQPKRPQRARGFRAEKKAQEKKIYTFRGDTTVGMFAEKTGLSLGEVIGSLMTNHNQMLNVNQALEPDLMDLLAIEFDVEINVMPESDESDVEDLIIEDDEGTLTPRPPVVTVMGHVDHGKTSLLDAIREADVAEGEAGGITQHIGAYMIDTPGGQITFLDTPGHEAFTSMRARGAGVTDIVILVVSADDPLMPQAVEAISHAREAEVPIIVAINKIDLPNANLQRITADLMGRGLIPEDQGGDTIFRHVSAKQKTGLDSLLEAILLQSEILELKANPARRAVASIIESKNDPQRGAVSTVLVERGTLRVGDNFVVGQQYGRVRAMFDEHGEPRVEAGPAVPAEILGIDGVPEAGEMMLVTKDERTAREVAEKISHRRRSRGLEHRRHVSLEGLKDMIDEGKTKELRLILKTDVQGSLEAVRQSIEKITHTEIKARILHAATGGINESDVDLADVSDAVIIGFNVRPETQAQVAADRVKIEIKTYQVIYHLIDDVKASMAGMLDKRYKEIATGRAEVRQIFRVSKVGSVAGSYVNTGEIRMNSHARLLRDNVVVYQGKVCNLRRFKDDVRSVEIGLECGIGLENYNDIKEGDEIETYKLEEIAVEL